MNTEILETLNSVAKTKNISKETVEETLKESLVIAAKKYLDLQKNIEVEIDDEENHISLYLRVTVADDYPDVDPEMDAEEVQAHDEQYMLLDEARQYNEEVDVGDFLEMEIPIENFGRAAITTAKQMLLQKMRNAERQLVFQEFKDKIGDLVSGTVQQVDRGTIYVNIGNAEAALPPREQIRKERYRQGETIKTYVVDVNDENKGHQIVLSRAHPNFLAQLFELEVPEISDGTVVIKGVSRDPGYRAKIAVYSSDERVDPIGACVGMKGNRVQAIVRELSNERIDIIHWTDDENAYIKRALSPAEMRQITDTKDGRVVVIVNDEDLSQAIGRGGQNVRLASKLIGKEIDIYGSTEFDQMSDDEKEDLFTPQEGLITQEKEQLFISSEKGKESKLSELESLFKKD